MITLSNRDVKALCLSFGIDEHDALLLLQHALNIKYSSLALSKEIKLSPQQFEKFKSSLMQRSKHVPVAKIVGNKAFYNYDFITNEHTLDPRPETELIIDLVLKYFNDKTAVLSILDLGCGTGCIGLSVLDLYPNAELLLADISDDAIAIAKRNALKLNLSEKCNCIKSDWFSNITGNFDIIVCNPPYIASDYKLDSDTLHDPHIALFGGENGLDAYSNIIPNVHRFLRLNGMLFLELGIGQAASVCNMTNKIQLLEIVKDLQGIERIAVFRLTDQLAH